MDKKAIQKKAELAAKKICIRGCFAGYNSCTKPQHIEPGAGGFKIKPPPMIGKDSDECPLSKYNVPDAPVKSFPVNRSERITLDDCFWLCANCKNCMITKKDGQLNLRFISWKKMCLDCPVWMARENIEECEAEARMS